MKDLLTLLAKRYIAGKDTADAIRAAKELNRNNILAAISNLGEDVRDAREAGETVSEYATLLELIDSTGTKANISIKLTHLGLSISDSLAIENASRVLEKAMELGNFARFDMEGSAWTQRSLDIFLRLHEIYPNSGIAIQSYLKRSASDIKQLMEAGASVRLVKGAYKEPPDIAYQRKADVDANFDWLMKELLMDGNRPAIATHDERLINEAIRFARSNGIPNERFDFEMLYGIKRKLQTKLVDEGFRVRVYLPYGKNWLPYLTRRIRERKENLYFIVKNIVD